VANNDPGNEFWRTEDDAVRAEFAAIFGSEDDLADDFTLDDDDELDDPSDLPIDEWPADWPDYEF
jgi:hypothetical protein